MKILQRVWVASGGQCGKDLAASMQVQLVGLERHGELVVGADRYDARVREELLGMSGATIDRYLAPARARDVIKGRSATKASPLLLFREVTTNCDSTLHDAFTINVIIG